MKETGKNGNRQISFSDLTRREIFALIREYFTSMFICLLIFALPWAIFSGLDLGLRSTLSGDIYSLWSNVLAFAILALIAYFILKDVPHFFRYLGDTFTQLYNIASRLSLPSQILLILFVVGYFVAWFKYPTLAFFFSIIVMIPAGLTYDRYVQVLREKSSDEHDDDRRA
jgi:hypothetical protein